MSNLWSVISLSFLAICVAGHANASGPDPGTEDSELRTAEASRDRTPEEAPEITMRLGGDLQLDYAWFDDQRDDGGKIRRGRLNVRGQIGNAWDYKVQYELATDSPELRDGYLRYNGLGPGRLWLGNYKQPASLELLTSATNTVFMEPAMATALSESRRIGIGYQISAPRYVAMLSAFGDEPNGVFEGHGVIGRGVWMPVSRGDRVIHFGGSASRIEPDDGLVRIRIRPESNVTDQRILDTGQLQNVGDISRVTLETLAKGGRLTVQGEYSRNDYSRSDGSPDLTFDGWYVFGSFFLTPDTRAYIAREAIPGKVTPAGRHGAWEVAIRYGTLDMGDRDFVAGSATATTLAVNWYPNENLRFQANYTGADADTPAGSDDPRIFQVRLQVAF